MPFTLRLSLLALFFGLTLAACGRTVQEEASESVTSAVEEEQAAEAAEDAEVEGEFAHLTDLVRSIRQSVGQAEMDATIAQARADGYSDNDIASAMGLAHLLTPGKRVLISVVFVRFKGGSAVPASSLDAAYEYASTPPRLREEEEEEATAEEASASEDEASDAEEDEDAADAEDEQPRRRGWFSWIPGL
jgi:hypothetical protein